MVPIYAQIDKSKKTPAVSSEANAGIEQSDPALGPYAEVGSFNVNLGAGTYAEVTDQKPPEKKSKNKKTLKGLFTPKKKGDIRYRVSSGVSVFHRSVYSAMIWKSSTAFFSGKMRLKGI